MDKHIAELDKLLGVKQLVKRSCTTLRDPARWTGKNQPKEGYHFGQGIYVNDITAAAEQYIKRDFKPIYEFQTGGKSLGSIFVPEEYVPKRPNVQMLKCSHNQMFKL